MWGDLNHTGKRRTAIATKTARPKISHEKLEKLIHQALDKNKAEDIVIIPLAGKSDFADSMVVASGTSARHAAALASHVVQALKKSGYESVPTEGEETGEWVLVDAGDVIVHIFRPDVRRYYNLEKMWSVAMPESEAAY